MYSRTNLRVSTAEDIRTQRNKTAKKCLGAHDHTQSRNAWVANIVIEWFHLQKYNIVD